MKQTTSEEKQANKFWAGFDPEKENKKFWRKYEALLQKHRQTKPKTSVDQPTETRDKYSPALLAYIWRVFGSLFYLVFVVGIAYEVFWQGEPMSVGLGIFAWVMLLGVLFWIIYSWMELQIFMLSKSGVYIKKVVYRKEVFFAWGDINTVELKQETSNEGGNWQVFTINHYTAGKEQSFAYHLSAKDHKSFKNAFEKRYIRFAISS